MEDNENPRKPPFTPVLELAEAWAAALGNQTQRVTATLPDGTIEPALSVHRGQFVLFCKEQGGALLIMAIVELPGESRARLRQLDKPTRDKLLTAMKLAIMQNERTGFSLFPIDIRGIEELQKYSVNQIVRIDAKDAGSFNRFADAIQELATVLLRSMMVFGPLQLAQQTPSADPMYR